MCPIRFKCPCVVPRDNSGRGLRPWALLSLGPPLGDVIQIVPSHYVLFLYYNFSLKSVIKTSIIKKKNNINIDFMYQ